MATNPAPKINFRATVKQGMLRANVQSATVADGIIDVFPYCEPSRRGQLIIKLMEIDAVLKAREHATKA